MDFKMKSMLNNHKACEKKWRRKGVWIKENLVWAKTALGACIALMDILVKRIWKKEKAKVRIPHMWIKNIRVICLLLVFLLMA